MKQRKIARCSICRQITVMEEDQAAMPVCCGKEMEELHLNQDDSLDDTHLPVIARRDGHLYAYAGAYEHPMEPDHYIEWLLLESEHSWRICSFQPHEEPKAEFQPDEAVTAVYAYCSKDGLWKTEI